MCHVEKKNKLKGAFNYWDLTVAKFELYVILDVKSRIFSQLFILGIYLFTIHVIHGIIYLKKLVFQNKCQFINMFKENIIIIQGVSKYPVWNTSDGCNQQGEKHLHDT